ncbi:hypothetical protein [Lacinutrix mariniflava]|uniref:hypothetical protein n=1 Tax=Lacinutrix mariniflava TaxID=342955 RepID=UPI0006E13B0E|nr:hypothetical protein [Lacinutrix mariniflava]
MALTITQQDTTISLEGTLNVLTVNSLKAHYDFIKSPFKSFTIDIDNVCEIDASALFTLKEMYRTAALSLNPFFIVGKRSEEVYEDFQFSNIA